MKYTRKTRKFGEVELSMLRALSAEALVSGLLNSDPIVALRGAAEVMLNEDGEKLAQMLQSEDFINHWRGYGADHQVDDKDHGYARQLEEKLKIKKN